MAFKLKDSPVIWKLAKDLGIKSVTEPVDDILKFCDKKVKSFLGEFPECSTLTTFLDVIAAKVRTTIIEVRSNEELDALQKKYAAKGEAIFATLKEEFAGEVFGITVKLYNHNPWENEFVSVIDCRDNKGARSYFTKWHEIAHLLALTDQQRLQFHRTQHKSPEHDPEEAMIDIIAGKFGFYECFINKHAKGDISFEIIEELRSELCAESSYQASLIGFIKAWPKPCILLYCKPSLKKGEQAMLAQESFDFIELPTLSLRAVKVTPSIPAIAISFRVYQNMRVPESSVIHSVFYGDTDYAEAEENLSSWETSSGSCLPDCAVNVKARRHSGGVYAIISPSS
jgi:hypothetical protein